MNNLAGFRPLPVAVWLATLLLVIVSCSSTSQSSQDGSAVGAANAAITASTVPTTSRVPTTSSVPTTTSQSPADTADTGDGPSDLASLVAPLPAAGIGIPEPPADQSPPVAMRIDSLAVATAPIIPVGLDALGDMEVPPADEVGWYRYGPTPGQEGSSVLAAHIAYNGENGVFVNLDEITIGSLIEIDYEDGTTAVFEATDIEQYGKMELPRESVFNRTGDPQLVLITCGGDFNSSLRSYSDNVVVYAKPIT